MMLKKEKKKLKELKKQQLDKYKKKSNNLESEVKGKSNRVLFKKFVVNFRETIKELEGEQIQTVNTQQNLENIEKSKTKFNNDKINTGNNNETNSGNNNENNTENNNNIQNIKENISNNESNSNNDEKPQEVNKENRKKKN